MPECRQDVDQVALLFLSVSRSLSPPSLSLSLSLSLYLSLSLSIYLSRSLSHTKPPLAEYSMWPIKAEEEVGYSTRFPHLRLIRPSRSQFARSQAVQIASTLARPGHWYKAVFACHICSVPNKNSLVPNTGKHPSSAFDCIYFRICNCRRDLHNASSHLIPTCLDLFLLLSPAIARCQPDNQPLPRMVAHADAVMHDYRAPD